MAVIVGNHIYVAVKLNEANDAYKLLCNINKKLEIGGIFRGLSGYDKEFTLALIFTLLTEAGFELITYDKKDMTIWFISKKIVHV